MNETKSRKDRWDRLKVFAGLLVVTFTVTLAAIIGNRLSDESLAVLAGAACGVGAAIPTSLLVVAVSRKRDEHRETLAVPQGTYPPVVVVAPSGGQYMPNSWNALPPSISAPMQRNFTVVGGATVDTGGGAYERYS